MLKVFIQKVRNYEDGRSRPSPFLKLEKSALILEKKKSYPFLFFVFCFICYVYFIFIKTKIQNTFTNTIFCKKIMKLKEKIYIYIKLQIF